jgi:2-phosphosulfolactate phosphatase
MKGTFIIDCFPESAAEYTSNYAIAAVDVIRATTMAVTAVATGHRCYVVGTTEEAYTLAERLENPLLAGEVAGVTPLGFHMNNSPAELLIRAETERPLILLSSSGTRLLKNASACAHVYVACLRNCSAVAHYMARRHTRIALIGAGSRGQFREEDQLCCGWIGKHLSELGYAAENKITEDLVNKWRHAPASSCALGDSAAYLERTGQLDDLDFILAHVNDLCDAFILQGQEVIRTHPTALTEHEHALIAAVS